MSNYVFSTDYRYVDYLQLQRAEEALRSEIRSASRSIVATHEELANDQIAVLKSISSEITGGLEVLSQDVRSVSDGIAELNSTFHWGFSAVLTRLGGLNDSLDQLIGIAKTPAQTWAYEQFEIARDAFRRGLYAEAVQYLDRAIHGHGDHTGYNLEYRFHFLRGTIRLGSFPNHSEDIVDLQEAKASFLNAAKYASHDYPKEAARSYLGAGWAAYCQGDVENAEKHTSEAIAIDASLAEAFFQVAKIRMHKGQPTAALPPLESAIRLDRGYTIKACADGDFKPHQGLVDSMLEALRVEVRDRFDREFAQLTSAVVDLEDRRATHFNFADEAPIDDIRRLAESASKAASSGTYFAYLDALQVCSNAMSSAVPGALATLRRTHDKRVAEHYAEQSRQEQEELATKRAHSDRARKSAETALWFSLGSILCLPISIVGLVLGIKALFEFTKGNDWSGAGRAIAAIVVGGLILALFVAVAFGNFVEQLSRQ